MWHEGQPTPLGRRRRLLLLTLGLVFIVGGFAIIQSSWAIQFFHPELSKFLRTYEAHHRNADLSALEEMVYWGQTTALTRRAFRFAMQEETRWPLRKIQVRRYREEDWSELIGSHPIPPAVQPRWKVSFHLDTDDQFISRWIVGETPEGLRLLGGPSTEER